MPAQLEALPAAGRHRDVGHAIPPVEPDFHRTANASAGHIRHDQVSIEAREASGESRPHATIVLERYRNLTAAVHRYIAIVEPVVGTAKIVKVAVAAAREVD